MNLLEHIFYDSDHHKPVALSPSDRSAAAFELQVLPEESGRPLSGRMLYRCHGTGAASAVM